MIILISHHWASDGDHAQKVANALRNLPAVGRIENLKGACGEQDHECLKRTLRTRYDHVIPLLSGAYTKDQFLVDELWAAISLDDPSKGFVLPAIIGDCEFPLPGFLRQRVVDFRTASSFEDAFKQLTKPLHRRPQVFVIMRFGDEQLDKAYEDAIQPAIDQTGFLPLRIDERKDSGIIVDQILREIDRSPVVFADLTGQRPNCYLEVGYALANDKEMVLAIRGDEALPFNIAGRRMIRWYEREQLKKELVDWLSEISGRLPGGPKPNLGAGTTVETPPASVLTQKASG